MKKLIFDIIDYTILLKQNFNLSVSFIYDHFPKQYFEKLLPIVVHNNKYCEYYKKLNLYKCVDDKHNLLEKNLKNPIVLKCHAGIKQWIFPAIVENKTVNLVMVAEHKSNVIPDFEKICQKSSLSADILRLKYETLPANRPTMAELSSKISPLVHMLELYYIYSKNYEDPRKILSVTRMVYEKAVNYILENIKNDITLSDVCNYCNYSSTYLNYVFKKHKLLTVKQYIISMKIKEAERLLLTSNMPITEIAQELGYNDSNYFSNQFKSFHKISPKSFRRNG